MYKRQLLDGEFKLLVHVSSKEGSLRAVSCEIVPSGDCEYAEILVRELIVSRHSKIEDPFRGEPIGVYVPVSARASMSGRKLSRHQFSHLVVIGTFDDGSRVGKIVEIPDGRVSREVQVELSSSTGAL